MLKYFETGDILLISGNKPLAKTIQWFEEGKWNHSGMLLWINDKLYVSESQAKGICISPFTYYYFNITNQMGTLRLKTGIKPEIQSKIIDFALPKSGHISYDYANLLVFQPIRYLSKKIFGKDLWLQPEHKAPKRFVCSEWVAYIYNHFFGYFEDWQKISPQDLYNSTLFNFKPYKRELL